LAAPAPSRPPREEDECVVADEACARADTWAAACYCADGGGEARGPVFSPELGLAVEAPRDPSVTVRQLWCVM
jgi:hypothetical protein